MPECKSCGGYVNFKYVKISGLCYECYKQNLVKKHPKKFFIKNKLFNIIKNQYTIRGIIGFFCGILIGLSSKISFISIIKLGWYGIIIGIIFPFFIKLINYIGEIHDQREAEKRAQQELDNHIIHQSELQQIGYMKAFNNYKKNR